MPSSSKFNSRFDKVFCKIGKPLLILVMFQFWHPGYAMNWPEINLLRTELPNSNLYTEVIIEHDPLYQSRKSYRGYPHKR